MLTNKTYTTDELASKLLTYPKGTKVCVTGVDSGGYDAIQTAHMVVGTAEEVNNSNNENRCDYEFKENRYKAGKVVILGQQKDFKFGKGKKI